MTVGEKQVYCHLQSWNIKTVEKRMSVFYCSACKGLGLHIMLAVVERPSPVNTYAIAYGMMNCIMSNMI